MPTDNMRTAVPSVIAREESEDVGRNPTDNPTLGDVIAARFARRDVLKGALGVAAIATAVSPLALAAAGAAQAEAASRYRFDELEAGADENHHVAAGLRRRRADPLGRSGAARGAGVQSDGAHRRRAAAAVRLQQRLPRLFPDAGRVQSVGAWSARGQPRIHQRGADVRRPGAAGVQGARRAPARRSSAPTSKWPRTAASVIEVKRENGKWQVVAGSKYARRIDANTPMDITGPAAGHPRMQTPADPAGRRVHGMFNNCAGGMTPWGTWLTCEENIHHYFTGKLAGRTSGSAQSPALWRAHRLLPVGRFPRSLQSRQGLRTSPTASAGWSRSIRSIRRRRRRSAPRSAAPSTKARPASSARTAATWSTWATTSGSNTSTGSSPPRASIPPTRGRAATSSTTARCRSRATTPTARSTGCRSFTARVRSPPRTALRARPTC